MLNKEKVKKQKDTIVEIEVSEIPENKEEKTTNVIELAEISMEDLILGMKHLSENKNILAVSKRAEEIRVIFYQQLKQINKEVAEKITKSEGKTKKSTLHPLEVEFKQAFNKFKREKHKYRKEKEEQEEKNLKLKKQIIEDIDNLTKQEESIKKTFEQFRALQDKWKNTGHVPIIENNNIWQSYHHHVEIFYDYIKINNDLRDLDFKRNLQEKIELCEKAEVLINEKSLNKMHDSLQELHEHWKNIGPVEKGQREVVWERFQIATKLLHKKRNDYFLLKKENDNKKLKAKNSICKKIDNLTQNPPNQHKDWKNLIIECRRLEEKWKVLGRLKKKDNKIAWNNLRNSLDNFYQKQNSFYKDKKEQSKKVIKKKAAICEKAEDLKNSTNWKNTTQQLIKLQEDWKNAGVSPKQKTDKIWKRFKSACNEFFNTKKAHFKDLERVKEDNLKAKQMLLKEVKKFNPSDDGKSDFKTLNNFSEQWKKCGFVSFKKQSIEKDFEKLINKHYNTIKMDKNEISKVKFINKITAINGNQVKLEKEKESIKIKIDEQNKILTQYKNNISFFGKSKSNDLLKKEVVAKINTVEKEIAILKEKQKIIDRY